MTEPSTVVDDRRRRPGPPRVLVVDEDRRLTDVMTIALTLEGWEVCVAATGREALAQVERFHPDGILLDITLPDLRGPNVAKALRERGDQTPVLFVTGRDTLEDRLDAFGAGGDDYLTKPFGLDVMVRRVGAMLGSSGLPIADQAVEGAGVGVHRAVADVGRASRRHGDLVGTSREKQGEDGRMTQLHDTGYRGFASDNYAGAHPEVIAAIAGANGGHQVSYGEDVYTARLQEVMRGHFGERAETFPVFNGTGANVLALQSILPRWGAVICSGNAHIHLDENAAPERVAGLKLMTVPVPHGKLTPADIDTEAWGWGDEHRAQPLAVSITQSTELGTAYSVSEVRAIADHVHERGMKLHMDGSRLANAAVTLGVPFRDFTTDAGVDILSFGGTKNGLLYGEAVVVLDPTSSEGLTYLRKINMQLASKMRFVSAQLLALLEGDLWLRSARHANAMAQRLRSAVEGIEGVRITQQTQANAVFAILPPGVADRLRESFRFYDWNAATNEVRWMCAFDTTEADIDAFAAAIRRELEHQPA